MPRIAPVDPDRLRALAGESCLWREFRACAETGSTNADLMLLAAAGEPEGLVLVAEHQTAGRGRFQRQWEDAAGSSIAFSALLRPDAARGEQLGWLPLLAGLAVREGIEEVTGVDVALKWPNDVLVTGGPRPGKLVGILVELAAGAAGLACIPGVGINVDMTEAELPVPTATSLSLSHARTLDKTEILAAVLRAWEGYYQRWNAGESLVADYLDVCASLGKRVKVQLDIQLGLGEAAEGLATGVDEAGNLLVLLDSVDVVALSAGDVVHLR